MPPVDVVVIFGAQNDPNSNLLPELLQAESGTRIPSYSESAKRALPWKTTGKPGQAPVRFLADLWISSACNKIGPRHYHTPRLRHVFAGAYRPDNQPAWGFPSQRRPSPRICRRGVDRPMFTPDSGSGPDGRKLGGINPFQWGFGGDESHHE